MKKRSCSCLHFVQTCLAPAVQFYIQTSGFKLPCTLISELSVGTPTVILSLHPALYQPCPPGTKVGTDGKLPVFCREISWDFHSHQQFVVSRSSSVLWGWVVIVIPVIIASASQLSFVINGYNTYNSSIVLTSSTTDSFFISISTATSFVDSAFIL